VRQSERRVGVDRLASPAATVRVRLAVRVRVRLAATVRVRLAVAVRVRVRLAVRVKLAEPARGSEHTFRGASPSTPVLQDTGWIF
jgi:hypothetical protein